jgi:hypothetical protein
VKTSLRVLCWIAGATTLSVAHSANLVTNPDFDDGLDGWSMMGLDGVMTLDSDIGFPAAPSLALSSDTLNPILGAEAVSQCIPADDGTRYDFFFNASGGGVWGGVDAFSDGDCSTLIGSADTEGFRSAGGTYAVTDFLLPDGTQSARVFLASIPPPLGSGGDTLFDHVLFGASGTLLDGININQEGLTGTWYNTTTSGQGMQFVIQPDDASPGTGVLFGAWYTYDIEAGGADTQRWYSIQAQVSSDSTIAPVTIYQNTGGKFDAPPATTAIAIGTGTLQFGSCTFGEFTYNLDDGRSGAIAFNRLLPNVDCVETGAPTDPPSDAGFSGAWYDPTLGGQGLIFDVSPFDTNGVATQIFGGWYTYAANGAPDSGATGQRWFSVQGANTISTGSSSLILYESTGGTFDSSATAVETDQVGTAILTFESCTSATFTYQFDAGDLAGTSGSIELSRLGAAPTSCPTTD